LKCDRLQPCSQCTRSRRENLCHYSAGPSRPPAPASDVGLSESAAKRARYDGPMTQIAVGNGRPEAAPVRNEDEASMPGQPLGRIHFKRDKSMYLGIGDRTAMLDHVKLQSNSCVKIVLTFIVRGCQTVYHALLRRSRNESFDEGADSLSKVVSTQAKESTDSFVPRCNSSIGNVEFFTRVLHKPTFIKEVEVLHEYLKSKDYTASNTLPDNIREYIVPQALGVLALSARLYKTKAGEDLESQISAWMELMKRWLDGLRGKKRLHISTLRTQVLLLQSNMNVLAQASDFWKESGDVVRSAMIMGLHQDPENYKEVSPFEKEQRRKLWRTIVELDMQSSLANGMPTIIRSGDFQARDLRNVDDFALREDMPNYPDHKAERMWTDALPQVILGVCLEERLEATNLLAGNINLDRDGPKLMSLAQSLERSLQTLPAPSRAEEAWGERNERSAGRLFTKVMLDMQLRRPTLSVYQSIMLSPQGSRYPEARRGAVRSAVAILNHLDALDPEVADPNTIKNRDQLNLFHVFCKKDIFQAALILCLEIRSFSIASSDDNGRATGLQDDLLPWTKTSLARIVENTFNSFVQRLGEFGSDLKDILPLIVVLQSARSDGTAEDKKLLMKRGGERLLKACREALPHINAKESTTPQNGVAQTPDKRGVRPISALSSTWTNTSP